MPSFSVSIFDKLKIYLYNKYGNNPGKMLRHTGVVGWAMSSIAQITAIILNDKIPKEQKMFMIPQELADAVVNIASFYFVTSTLTSVAKQAVRCGKILPKNIKDYFTNAIKPSNVKKITRLGKYNFNVEKHLPKYLKDSYNSFKNGADVIATLFASILSCNILTPILRNIYASKKQQKNISRLNNTQNDDKKHLCKFSKLNPVCPKSIYSYSNSGNLKV